MHSPASMAKPSIVVWATIAAAAYLSATISAIVGMAGGITLLAVMASLLPSRLVVPLHGVVQFASNATRTAVFLRHVRWSILAIYSLPLIIGVGCAAALWSGAKLSWFRPLIGVFILTFLLWRRFAPKLRSPPLWVYAPLGLCAGFLTVYVGAVGPFIAPFFLRDDLEREEVVATKAVCQALGHLLKLPAFAWVGFAFLPFAVPLAGLVAAVIVGTFTGKALLKRLSPRAFTRAFQLVLAAVALQLIARGLWP